MATMEIAPIFEELKQCLACLTLGVQRAGIHSFGFRVGDEDSGRAFSCESPANTLEGLKFAFLHRSPEAY